MPEQTESKYTLVFHSGASAFKIQWLLYHGFWH